ncbi:type II secretion system GspH family protein [Solirubrobacter ginsenosidimutans]|uniref:Type II secretion system GspH family protein n=1 Tax=Solirubrobacter ginsenosidimutans TaxID=490573 RepID=A0A9X3N3R4_9ACTN|nr:prepilin-type N-terminal cleavage/methylation domain-containing protein [Solirubrobacter ginsenosidimutans]MDA0166445.1 type II secretion system GspH family protein [Solirubrobacter ginsenosidimutans]
MSPRADDGYTLVELLVAVLIIGILMAISVALLLNQQGKAQDAEAKTTVVTAAKAIEAYGTDHGGYGAATPDDLAKIERSLGQARGLTVTSTATTYTVAVDSLAAPGARFSLERNSSGESIRDCSLPGTGACRATADASGNRW